VSAVQVRPQPSRDSGSFTDEEPAEKPGRHSGGDPSSRSYTHPAFGQIQVSRTTGSRALYGSDFLHESYVTVRIARSELERGLGTDWYFSRDEIVEVHLSAAQWATFVSSMNVGSGVPCTISHVMGKQAPGIPLRQQRDVFKADIDAKLAQAAGRVDEAIAEIVGEIGTSLSKAKREKVLASLHALSRTLGDSLPFYGQMFDEHMENMVERAKVEVNAYVETALSRAGMEALRSGSGGAPLLRAGGEGGSGDE
jgi:hypothetical protein